MLRTEGDIFPLLISLDNTKVNGKCLCDEEDEKYKLFPKSSAIFNICATVLEPELQKGSLILDGEYLVKEVPVIIEGAITKFNVNEKLDYDLICSNYYHRKIINVKNEGNFSGSV